jgi:hypothetical protein
MDLVGWICWILHLHRVLHNPWPVRATRTVETDEYAGGRMNQSFREWLAELWRQNCDEHDGWGEPRWTLQEYFARYKWWLKREYRYQRNTRRPS